MKRIIAIWKIQKRYFNNDIFYISVFVGIGLGVLNAWLDTFIFYVGTESFIDFLIFNVPATEAFARTLVLVLFVVFGYLFSKKYYQLEDNKILLEYSLNKSPEAIYWLDKKGNFYYVNYSAAESLGYRVDEVLELNILNLHRNDKTYTIEQWKNEWILLQKKKILRFETQHVKKNGSIIDVEIIANFVIHEKLEYIVAFVRDVSERKIKEQEIMLLNKQLEKSASLDSLTEIFNRSRFDGFLKQLLSEYDRYSREFSLIIYDIDNFKKVNDIYGHKVGDNVLQEFVAITKKQIRDSDIFARWGGEEFVILLPQTRLEEASNVANKIRVAVQEHHFDNVGDVTVSLGVSMIIKNDTSETIFSRVDKALYEAKNTGRNKVVIVK